ncbi:MarR family winged helix-turn-helix transcriptional regulator [Demequina capsici]|uniref:MarR family winged helix-turn-helix transcriptional regulator n=1 Tax=Demequina capsici TaxID=3075620 RepID=A0AA96FCR0_9MICO|nr:MULTISPECIES: MarR family winged helix-turn-helix transcriptional regulator [unclassified Demequina]WNM24410.1 MarR family winged helix-turn-helix transcriptional regulator [Demequina sp. OYTSA14]WNM27244.1 MarR family winged helix-turn-helix transcriptional regulator [Demequina sp. PMTSA13]
MSDTEQEPQRHTGYLIRRAQQAHLAAWSRIVSTEITSVQYSILVVLDRRGSASQRELCDEVDLDRSTVADLVTRMERRGLVARERDSADARRNVVTLTERGLAERIRLQPLVAEANAQLTAALTDEQRNALRSALNAMLGN